MYICVYTNVCVYVYMYVCMCIYLRMYICMYIILYRYSCICVCVYLCVYSLRILIQSKNSFLVYKVIGIRMLFIKFHKKNYRVVFEKS